MASSRRSPRSLALVLACVVVPLLAACGTDPTATPTPGPTATPTPTLEPGLPTPTPVRATPTPTATSVPQRDLAEYFRGKTISFTIGFSPGGGYDLNARITAAHIRKYLPGNPQTLVRNVAGAGGLRAKQAVYRSEPDGLTVGIIHGRNTLPVLIGETVEGFDPRQVRLIGSAEYSPSQAAFYLRRDVATSWDEMMALGTEITTGETAAGFAGALGPTLLEELGYPIKTVYGYGGTSEIMAAVDRGELMGTTRGAWDTVQNLFPEWGENDFLVPIFQYGAAPLDQQTLDLWGVTDVPWLFDLIDETPAQRQAFENVHGLNFSKTYWLPPETPDDIHQAWADAFAQVVQDPEWRESAIASGIVIGFADAETLTEQMKRGEAMLDDPETLEWFKKLTLGS